MVERRSVGERAVCGGSGEWSTVQKQDVQPTVSIVIKERPAGPHCFHEVALPRRAIEMRELDPRCPRDITELYPGRRDGSRRGGEPEPGRACAPGKHREHHYDPDEQSEATPPPVAGGQVASTHGEVEPGERAAVVNPCGSP